MITESHKNFFETERGITGETLIAFGAKSVEDTIIFPYENGEKARKMGPGKREFKFTKGQTPSLFHAPDVPKESWCFLVEGETDCMRLWQEGYKNTYGMNGINGLKGAAIKTLGAYTTVFVILDNDADYTTQRLVETAWGSMRGILGSKARRVTLPADVKDVCEFFESYTDDTFKTIMKGAIAGNYHYNPLDLSLEPPAYEWVVDSLICREDVTLLVGEPNVGKSWISLSLAVAMADEHPRWLGYDMTNHGKVLYVDEENAYSLIYHRLQQLGLRNKDNIRYLHQRGVRLDRNFDRLLDDAIMYQPSLIVLDSLTRLHTKDENSAGAMAGLFNDAIGPLTRETGAAIMLLHHTNKGDSTSSYNRTRGSSDIGASIDCGIDVRKTGTSSFSMCQYKARRTQVGKSRHIEILDTADGRVELVQTDGQPF